MNCVTLVHCPQLDREKTAARLTVRSFSLIKFNFFLVAAVINQARKTHEATLLQYYAHQALPCPIRWIQTNFLLSMKASYFTFNLLILVESNSLSFQNRIHGTNLENADTHDHDGKTFSGVHATVRYFHSLLTEFSRNFRLGFRLNIARSESSKEFRKYLQV